MNTKRMAEFRNRYGPWAVVTGASSGIGRECALWLARAGLNLILVGRRDAELQALAGEIERRFGVQVRKLVADLSEEKEVRRVDEAAQEFDVGLLIAAAGFGITGDFAGADLPDELGMLDVNCRAVLMQSRHFGERFVRRGRGGLVLFGSLLGFQGAPRAAHYAATKAYVQTLAEGLHVELAPHGVDVLASAPGPVHTGFAYRAKMRMGAADNPVNVAHATLSALGRKMTVAPGPLSKFLTGSLMTAPRWLRVRIMSAIIGRMTRHRPRTPVLQAGAS